MAGKHLSALCGLLLASSVTAAAASSYYYTGNEIYSMCTAQRTDHAPQSMCMGFIVGVWDAMWSHGYSCKNATGVTVGQLVDVAKASFEKNPAQRHLPASLLIESAFVVSFLCVKKN